MADVTIQRDGRRWAVDDGGIQSLTRRYRIQLDGNNLAANGEAISFSGVPAIGTAHPSYPKLKVASYDVIEGEGTDKRVLDIDVKYERAESESTTPGEGETAEEYAVEQWGWEPGTDERELVTDMDGNPVLNSAGDPFESVPTVSTPAPVFTKIVKFATRQDFAEYVCTVNSGAVTIGNVSCPAWTLLCNVSEQRIIGGSAYKYRYTIQLRYRTNKVKINGSNSLTELGWHMAITDAGMRQKNATTGKLELIKVLDPETKKPCVVTSPELLNGSGVAVTRSSGSNPTPYNLAFKAYATSSFPPWFYSEPTDNPLST